ncbi:SDR family oxidoreductase [Streptomyces sp. NPDC056909]|uniref:SDR family oxidoreductase n=1 Tax=Streptomyces sp. NPDC056909 TaxID=3345963 RepID=UPI00367C7DE5
MSQHIAVVIGVGGMGQAIARRVGPGTHLLLADFNEETLETATGQLRGEGYEVTSQTVDVTSRESVAALAKRAASLGEVRYVVHTAGLSPAQAPVPAILAVDLLGVALAAEEFGEVVAPGGAGVVIASMAGHNYPPFSPEQTLELATTPADELLGLPVANPDNFPHGGAAYAFAKRANLVRVQAASVTWGARGARINAISPGHIATPMGNTESGGANGAIIQAMIDGSNAKREGTPADIARAAEFLLSPGARFISGSDMLVDGGVIAALQTGHITLR